MIYVKLMTRIYEPTLNFPFFLGEMERVSYRMQDIKQPVNERLRSFIQVQTALMQERKTLHQGVLSGSESEQR